jgi:hypothetical protein
MLKFEIIEIITGVILLRCDRVCTELRLLSINYFDFIMLLSKHCWGKFNLDSSGVLSLQVSYVMLLSRNDNSFCR